MVPNFNAALSSNSVGGRLRHDHFSALFLEAVAARRRSKLGKSVVNQIKEYIYWECNLSSMLIKFDLDWLPKPDTYNDARAGI